MLWWTLAANLFISVLSYMAIKNWQASKRHLQRSIAYSEDMQKAAERAAEMTNSYHGATYLVAASMAASQHHLRDHHEGSVETCFDCMQPVMAVLKPKDQGPDASLS